ncbi:hypothetical protein DES34_11470 [Brevibacillus brevis]|nr:hypothetical protein DES34_11470 [Brevibacillus brevis]VEF90296.1 Uncharacterised protein [Brevibacillus brevis]
MGELTFLSADISAWFIGQITVFIRLFALLTRTVTGFVSNRACGLVVQGVGRVVGTSFRAFVCCHLHITP